MLSRSVTLAGIGLLIGASAASAELIVRDLNDDLSGWWEPTYPDDPYGAQDPVPDELTVDVDFDSVPDLKLENWPGGGTSPHSNYVRGLNSARIHGDEVGSNPKAFPLHSLDSVGPALDSFEGGEWLHLNATEWTPPDGAFLGIEFRRSGLVHYAYLRIAVSHSSMMVHELGYESRAATPVRIPEPTLPLLGVAWMFLARRHRIA